VKLSKYPLQVPDHVAAVIVAAIIVVTAVDEQA
jgi:hypothetical protein